MTNASLKVVIHAGRVIDGTGAEPQVAVDILLEDGRIQAIMPRGEATIDDAYHLDAREKTVLPGLIDTHVHICFDPNPGHHASRVSEPIPAQTIRGVQNARAMLESGITSIRTLGTAHDLDFTIRDAIQQGIIPGPRILAAGRGISMTGGHGHYISMESDGPEAMRKAVRTAIRNGANVIKLFVTGGVMTPGGKPGRPQLNRDELDVAILEAHKIGIKVTGHAEGRQGVNAALAAGIDCIEHGYFMNNEEGLAMLVDKGVYLVPTLMAYQLIAKGLDAGVPPEAAANADIALEYNTVGFRNAVQAGAKIAMGSDAGTAFNDHGRSWRELIYMVKYGMTPMQAIVAATRNGADLLGIGDEVGTIEPGKVADIIVVEGDPLSNIAQIGEVRAVIKEGKIVRNDLTEVYGKPNSLAGVGYAHR
jgi:imidazolonepropionase-like amidohydrolase